MRILCLVALLTMCSCSNTDNSKDANVHVDKMEYALVIHGGAGTILKENLTKEVEQKYLLALEFALQTGEKILKDGGNSLDAVKATINVMEDSPLFNAGKGAVFNYDGHNEMDASIMEGANLNAGAVGGVSQIRNPIDAAIAVMNNSEHVMLTGKGAETFAKSQNIELVDSSYFYTEKRWNALQKVKAKDIGAVEEFKDYKFGTVGAVALDKNGDIVAGTSTGGMTNKRWNRIGDSPIIGAGTYANNLTCGVSCTGHGEFFIRYAVAHDISAAMEYKSMTVDEAGQFVINKKLVDTGGSGGAIILDKNGNVSMPFNSAGMYRGYLKSNGEREIKIFKD